MANEIVPANAGEFLLYQTEDGKTRVQVRLGQDTVWLSLNQMADLFQRDKSVISKHIANVFAEGELTTEGTVANFATVQQEGTREVTRSIEYYNLDVIISVGYRVKSLRGTQFRMWATQRLREYIVKGFTLDDARLKQAGGGDHFDELLERIRDIRSSERVFWRKVLDIYALSEDYDPRAESSTRFFQTVQNKMHWAITGQTAAEIVHQRADADQLHMGLTSWDGATPRKGDVVIAKNYLSAEELHALNLLVSAYLDFAELQALARKPMYMADWIAQLDDVIRLTGRDILTHAGHISHDAAKMKAELEYARYRAAQAALPQPVDQHFAAAVQEVKQIEKTARTRKQGGKKKGGEE
jgi:hypothetical protein